MKDPRLEDLLIMLVSAGWTKRDIVQVLHQASSMNAYDLEDEIADIGYELSGLRRSSRRKFGYGSYRTEAKKIPQESYSDLYLKVRDMLVHDLGMSNEQIVNVLAERLGGGEHIPPLSKKSLANWLERLTSYYQPSEILHAAVVVREKYGKGKQLDWGVRGES